MPNYKKREVFSTGFLAGCFYEHGEVTKTYIKKVDQKRYEELVAFDDVKVLSSQLVKANIERIIKIKNS